MTDPTLALSGKFIQQALGKCRGEASQARYLNGMRKTISSIDPEALHSKLFFKAMVPVALESHSDPLYRAATKMICAALDHEDLPHAQKNAIVDYLLDITDSYLRSPCWNERQAACRFMVVIARYNVGNIDGLQSFLKPVLNDADADVADAARGARRALDNLARTGGAASKPVSPQPPRVR